MATKKKTKKQKKKKMKLNKLKTQLKCNDFYEITLYDA